MASSSYVIWLFLFLHGLCLSNLGDEIICWRQELGEEPGAGQRHQTPKKRREREAWEAVINHNSTRTQCCSPCNQWLLSWILITIAWSSWLVVRWFMNPLLVSSYFYLHFCVLTSFLTLPHTYALQLCPCWVQMY